MATGKPIYDHVEIDSVDVDSYRVVKGGFSFKIQEDKSLPMRVKSATIYLSKAVSGALTMDETLGGALVTIQRGVASATEKYIFRGHVINIATVGGYYVVTAADKLASTSKRKVTASFDINIDAEAGKFSEIFKTLINDYTGLTADATSVQDSGTVRTINKFICRASSVYERCSKILETIGWQGYYDSNIDKVYAQPPGYINQATAILEGVNMVEVPKWDTDYTQLYNKVEVRGAVQEVETVESGQIGVTTGYTTSSVQLLQEPNSVKVLCDSGTPPTTLRQGGIANSTASYDYEVDKSNKQIVWSDTYTPGGSDYVQILYSFFRSCPIVHRDQASIKAYSEDPVNPEPKEIVLHKNDITNVDDADVYCQQYLDDHKDPVKKTKVKVTDVSDLATGQRVYIQDDTNVISGYFYVLTITQSSPYKYDEIEVTSNDLNEDRYEWNVDQRVKRLEEQQEGEDELLLNVLDFNKTIEFSRYSYTTERYKICDSFIPGHPINGLIGMGTEIESFDGSKALWTPTDVVLTDWGTKLVGTGSLLIQRTGAGTGSIESVQSFGALNTYTGASSGMPTKGTIGLWVYTTNPTLITNINLQIGSSNSDYVGMDALAYASVDGYENWSNKTFQLQSGWNYMLFHLADGSMVGTPDWTAVDFCNITLTYSDTASCYFDYMTISMSNYIGLNGIGTRRMTIA